MLIFYLIKNKMINLLTYLVILLIVFGLVFLNRKNDYKQHNIQESFIENKLSDSLVNEKKINSYPLIVTPKDVPQLFDLQEIYPEKNDQVFSVARFPNVVLPGRVVGCGGRRQPCYGGSQQVVNNILPPLEISENNIAPNKISLYPLPKFQQVGYLYKIFGAQNMYLPLYQKIVGNRYPRYKYFTKNNENIVKKVIIPSVFRKLGTNDEVRVEGYPYSFRVTVNEQDMPVYPRVSE